MAQKSLGSALGELIASRKTVVTVLAALIGAWFVSIGKITATEYVTYVGVLSAVLMATIAYEDRGKGQTTTKTKIEMETNKSAAKEESPKEEPKEEPAEKSS